MFELCVRCGKPVPYEESTTVADRQYYVEGAGQLCEACWKRIFDNQFKVCPKSDNSKSTNQDCDHQSLPTE